MPKQEKIQLLEEVKESLSGVSGVVLANFKGMSVLELETLRKKVAKEGGIAKVVKNTLLEKAFESVNMKGLDSYLKENTVVFSSKQDIMSLLKVVADYSKTNDKFIIKGGYIDGVAMDKAGVVEMSKMPSRHELLGMIAGGINGVLTSFVGSLNGVMTTFVGTIEALEKKKEGK